jgi:hypothetical protein
LADEKVVKKLKKNYTTKLKNGLPLDRGIDFSDSVWREHVQEDIFSGGVAFYLLDERF